MKKVVVAMLGTVLLIGFNQIQAQVRGQNRNAKTFKQNKEGKHGLYNGFGKDLQLTDEQKAKAKTINEEYRAKIKALKSNNNLTMGEYKKQEATLQQERREKLNALLTPEQKEKIKDNREEKQEKKLEKMKSTLNLSDDQVNKIKDIHSKYAAKVKAIRDDNSLTPDQKKQQLKTINDDRKKEVDGVLTPDQVKKRDELIKGRKKHK